MKVDYGYYAVPCRLNFIRRSDLGSSMDNHPRTNLLLKVYDNNVMSKSYRECRIK